MSVARLRLPVPTAETLELESLANGHTLTAWYRLTTGGYSHPSKYLGWESHCMACGLGMHIIVTPANEIEVIGRCQRELCRSRVTGGRGEAFPALFPALGAPAVDPAESTDPSGTSTRASRHEGRGVPRQPATNCNAGSLA